MFQLPQIPNLEDLISQRRQRNSQILQGQPGAPDPTEAMRKQQTLARLLLNGAPNTGPVDSFGEMAGSLAMSAASGYQNFQQRRQTNAQQALAPEVADMSAAERDALRLGVRAAVDETMGRVRNGSLKGRQLLDSDFNERKILTVLGEDEGRALINAMQGEQAMADTANQAIGGSATSRRMDNPFRAGDGSGRGPMVRGVLQNAGNLDFGDAAARAIGYATDALDRRSAATMASELGPALTATGSQREKILADILLSGQERTASQALDPRRRAIAEALTRGGALTLAPHVRP